MSIIDRLKTFTAVSRIAVLALLVVMVATAALHLGASTAYAGQASLSWTAPTTFTDGTPLTNLKGYQVHTGTASGSYAQVLDVGNVTSYTLAGLNDGTTYYVAVTAYDTSGNSSGYSNQVSFTTAAATTTASALYTITASAGSGGTITPSGAIAISSGLSQTYAIAPSTGYYLASVSVDGAVIASNLAKYSYTFSNVTSNHTISATFAVATYTITASAGANGSISPTGTQYLNYGTSASYSITPATGYKIAAVTVDGASVGAVSSYSFSTVAANHTIAASFASSTTATYSITATTSTGGSISPAGATTVNSGSSQAYTITPSSGYYLASVSVDGAVIASNLANYSYTFSNVTSNHTISATFAVATYTITASAGANGSISPTGTQYLNYGTSASYSITPATGYKIAAVTVDGASVGAVSSYSFSTVAANHTIAASFTASTTATYSITATAGTGGSISPAGATTVNSGSSQAYTITPSTGYYLASVSVDGAVIASNLAKYSYTFSNVTSNHTISATFAVATYAITASAGANGSISPTGTQYVKYGTSASYSITPATGYKIAAVTVDGASVGAVTSYSFSTVAANHTISATFVTTTVSTTSTTIPHTSWTLKYADSQELVGQNGAAVNAFDGNTTSMWHTQWLTSSPSCPHEIQINLGKSYTLNGFSYLPRQDGNINGTIAKYEFYVSSDGATWGTPVATGTFANNTTLKQVSFAAKSGQYIRLRALSEVNGNPWTSAAEINVTGY